MIRIAKSIALDEGEIEERFILAGGPGGQHVNKAATAVQLRFDVAGSPSLPREVRERLLKLAGRRVSAEGVLVIEARRFRSQERNRGDALERLVALIRAAAVAPRSRRKTRPSPTARKRRLEEKRRRGQIKHLRRPVPGAES